MVPSLKTEMPGCLFAPRCTFATERCSREVPPLKDYGDGHLSACWESERVAALATAGALEGSAA
jgi:peptide/nickel transport system ATP-binding protein